ncbi:GAF and ANTAR domain-containing protein [Glaciibacter sp. 2TAF33]|uniref:GAF and ANTAR domain-containing protein n=1 Tax=Glaciibacter sp. 2TAF33 TaxID=3233015 RepID=UPI003F9349FE
MSAFHAVDAASDYPEDEPERAGFAAAADELSNAYERKTSLCAPFVGALPVAGAAVSILGETFGTETVCASDKQAARLDELQIDIGEGPCWQARSTRRPVLTGDVQRGSQSSWPVFSEAIRNDGVGALFAFPLIVGSLVIGAVDLYAREPGSLTETQVEGAEGLAAIAARQVLRKALSESDRYGLDDPETDARLSRRVVHQATGMVLAQLGLSASDALIVIRGHAFSAGRSVREVATEIVERRLDLSSNNPEI